MDDRLNQRLEEQLRDAHARNGELLERIDGLEKEKEKLNAVAANGRGAMLQLERAEAKRKAAEENAAVAQRERKKAGYEVMRLQEQVERLTDGRDRARDEAGRLAELEARIETAKGVGDLFS